MADDNKRHAVTPADLQHQIHDLRLKRGIELAGRFVGNHQLRIACYCLRNHDPLPLPPAQLMRIGGID